MMNEIWKPVKNYVGLYMVSNLGRVMNCRTGRILKEQLHERGYLRVTLSKNGKQKMFKVHRLVMIAFVGYVEGKDQVNHIDGDKSNNRLDNLEWCTQSDNMKHAYDNGLAKSKKKVRAIRCIETGEIYKNAADASRQLGYDRSGILRTAQGVYETLYGYHFKFVS